MRLVIHGKPTLPDITELTEAADSATDSATAALASQTAAAASAAAAAVSETNAAASAASAGDVAAITGAEFIVAAANSGLSAERVATDTVFFDFDFGTAAQALLYPKSALFGFQDGMINGQLSASVGSNILTVAIKTLAGTDPSATDPVYVIFRNVTSLTGDYAVITLTAATSIAVPDTALLGTTNSIPFRIWVVGFNDGGTFRLGVINCLTSSGVITLRDSQLASSTTVGTGSDSAGVFYTGTGVTSKAYRILGYLNYDSGLATAGTWSANPSKVQLFGPGISKPGDIIQQVSSFSGAVATGTTQTPNDDTIPTISEGDQYFSVAITPTATMNRLKVEGTFNLACSVAANLQIALHQGGAAVGVSSMRIDTADRTYPASLLFMMLTGTVSAITNTIRIGPSTAGTVTLNGNSAARLMGGVHSSGIIVTEIMA